MDFAGLSGILGKILVLIALSSAASFIMNVINNRLAFRTVQDVRARAIRKIEALPLSYLDSHSSGDLDKKYKKELDEQRIARIYCNGYFAAPRYYVLPAFFGERSSSGSLDGTMVFSESCDFLGSHDIIGWFTGDQALGGDRDLKTEFPDAMLGAGAKSVQGFVNSVSASYCISLITYELYDLRDGFMLYQALTFAQEHYGSDDSQYHDTDWPARAFAYGDTDASLGRPVPGTKLQNGTVVYAGTIEVVTVSKRLEEVGAGDSGYTIFGPTALDHEYAILVLDEPAKATGWSYGPYADITRDVSSNGMLLILLDV